MQSSPAFVTLLLCYLSFLFLPQHFPKFLPLFFAPYLVRKFWELPKERVLLRAFLIGIFCDISSSYLFGIHTLLYVGASIFSYRLQKIFLKDRLFSLSLTNTLFSLIFSSLAYPLLAFFNHRFSWSLSTTLLDIKNAILIDFPYGMLIYLLPCTISLGICKIKVFRGLLCY
ncbi:rod shape-determining protein MreD [Chlamydia sp. 17-3921]|uniref:rod shape-determining protein MreD n=1 Tax=Chlamydia sp. 17-3921 TaxID=2675798 RepID=UPI0019197F81|nr:rod shape-determining protein MreD [Chlamydia sp. 17-3921]